MSTLKVTHCKYENMTGRGQGQPGANGGSRNRQTGFNADLPSLRTQNTNMRAGEGYPGKCKILRGFRAPRDPDMELQYHGGSDNGE